MAKKKMISKNKQTDWKFVALLIGIGLIGLSLFVVNQRTTFKSRADSEADCKRECDRVNWNLWAAKQSCKRQCEGKAPLDLSSEWDRLEKESLTQMAQPTAIPTTVNLTNPPITVSLTNPPITVSLTNPPNPTWHPPMAPTLLTPQPNPSVAPTNTPKPWWCPIFKNHSLCN